jgi:hypothetical protein
MSADSESTLFRMSAGVAYARTAICRVGPIHASRNSNSATPARSSRISVVARRRFSLDFCCP